MDRTQQDLLLFKQWKEDPSKENFQAIYRQMLPVINYASDKAARNSQVPRSVFKLEAAQQFYNALQKFDPSRGYQLNTYVHSRVEPKLKRINYKYQNIARIPERDRSRGGVSDINKLQNSEVVLRDKLGRMPSDVEIAQDLGFTVQDVGRLRSELRKDLSLTAMLDEEVLSNKFQEDDILYAVYYDLPPEAQLVLDHIEGLHGKRKISTALGKPDWSGIAQELGMSISKIQRMKKIIAKEFKRHQG